MDDEMFDYVVGMDEVAVRDDGMMVMVTKFTKLKKTVAVVHAIMDSNRKRRDLDLTDYGPGFGTALPNLLTLGVW